MTLRILLLVLAGAAPLAAAEDLKPASLAVAELKRDTPVDFEKEILPLLKNNCLACHNQTKAKADLVLETPATILKGGENGPAVVAGKSAESLIFKVATHQEKPFMPPKDNKVNAVEFTPAQLALLKLWIQQGAKGEVHGVSPVVWLDQPPALDPIFAIALTQDGQFAAAGRGNRIDVYHVPSGRFITQLEDPKLAAGFTNAAHRDLVNALAFNPEGSILASAGYREVKLWQKSRNVQKSSLALSNSVQAFAVSPDRKWLATAGPDHSIALLDSKSGQQIRTVSGHSNTVTCLRFSPDNLRLASVSEDKTLRICTVADGTFVASAEIPDAATSVAWLSNGTQIAVGSADNLIRVFDVPLNEKKEALEAVQQFQAHTSSVTTLEAVPGTNHLLSGCVDGTVFEWSLSEPKPKPVREMKHGACITAIAVRPDGKRFATAGTNNVVRLWDAGDGTLVAELKGDRYASELVAETGRALTVAKSDIEFRKKLLEGNEVDHTKQAERVVKAADTNAATEKIFAEKKKTLDETGASKEKAGKDLTGLLAEIERITTGFDTASKTAKDTAAKAKGAGTRAAEAKLSAERAAAARVDREKIAADAAAVAEKSKAATRDELPAEAMAAAQKIAEDSADVAEKAKALAAAVAADAESKKKLAADAAAASEKAIDDLAGLSFSAGQLKPAYDKTLAEAPERRKNATNQLETTTKALAAAEADFKQAETRKSVTNHELELAMQSASRASNALATARSVLTGVESAGKKIEADLEKHKRAAASLEQPVRALAFSPDNQILASAGSDQCIHTWNANTGAPYEVLRGHTGTVSRLSFANAATVMSVADDQRVVFWDLNPPWELARVIGSGDVDSPLTDRVNALDFSPDGRVLATASGEPTRSGEVKLWSVNDGKLLNAFTNVHSDAVLSLRFSPDGRYLASSSADRFVRVVELATGKVVKAFEGHTSYVLGVAWKRDSRTLASAGADKVIKMWDFVTGERKKNIEGAEKEVTAIAFVGATGDAVAASGDSQVRLLRESGEKVRSYEGASEFMNTVAVTPDGQIVVAGGQDGMMHVWNGTNGLKLATFGPVR